MNNEFKMIIFVFRSKYEFAIMIFKVSTTSLLIIAKLTTFIKFVANLKININIIYDDHI